MSLENIILCHFCIKAVAFDKGFFINKSSLDVPSSCFHICCHECAPKLKEKLSQQNDEFTLPCKQCHGKIPFLGFECVGADHVHSNADVLSFCLIGATPEIIISATKKALAFWEHQKQFIMKVYKSRWESFRKNIQQCKTENQNLQNEIFGLQKQINESHEHLKQAQQTISNMQKDLNEKEKLCNKYSQLYEQLRQNRTTARSSPTHSQSSRSPTHFPSKTNIVAKFSSPAIHNSFPNINNNNSNNNNNNNNINNNINNIASTGLISPFNPNMFKVSNNNTNRNRNGNGNGNGNGNQGEIDYSRKSSALFSSSSSSSLLLGNNPFSFNNKQFISKLPQRSPDAISTITGTISMKESKSKPNFKTMFTSSNNSNSNSNSNSISNNATFPFNNFKGFSSRE